MGAQQRVYRNRMRSTASLQKMFNALELISASRIARARAAVTASSPYARALTRAVSAVATHTRIDHPLTTERENIRRAAVLIIASDRGMAGAYSSAVLRESERLVAALREDGKEVRSYLVGRKAVAYHRFRRRPITAEWTGFTDSPPYEAAEEIGHRLMADFLAENEDDVVDEIHIVFTRFVNMVRQEPLVIRLLPLEVVEGEEPPAEGDVLPLYEFEPSADQVLDALLPQYISHRVFNCLLQAAASEHAARQRAMKSASDNAKELIRTYTRLANQARQAEITQEISEIVGGADALAQAVASR